MRGYGSQVGVDGYHCRWDFGEPYGYCCELPPSGIYIVLFHTGGSVCTVSECMPAYTQLFIH